MDHKNLLAIDIHTHAEVSCRNPFDNYGEEYDRAADKYFGSPTAGPPLRKPSRITAKSKVGLVMFTVDSESKHGPTAHSERGNRATLRARTAT